VPPAGTKLQISKERLRVESVAEIARVRHHLRRQGGGLVFRSGSRVVVEVAVARHCYPLALVRRVIMRMRLEYSVPQ
jgi:hypothetical protein